MLPIVHRDSLSLIFSIDFVFACTFQVLVGQPVGHHFLCMAAWTSTQLTQRFIV